MNIQSILQTRFVVTHFVCLLILIIAGRLLGRRRGGFELWFMAAATSGLIIVLLGLGLLSSFFEPRVPSTFSSFPFVLMFCGLPFLGYLVLFGVSFALRPPLQSAGRQFILGMFGMIVVNLSFLALPVLTGSTVTLRVMSAQKKPISGARFSYTSEHNKKTQTAISDEAGHIRFRLNRGDSLKGHILPFQGYTDVELYVSTRYDWFVSRKWYTCFGSQDYRNFGSFVSDLDDRAGHSIDIYLPRNDRAELLPYRQLERLADQYKKTTTAISHLDPYSKQAERLWQEFRPEFLIRNLESYVQLLELARVFGDPKTSGYPADICGYMRYKNDELRKLLAHLSRDQADQSLRERALSQMLSVLGILAPDGITWQDKHHLIQERLDADKAVIKGVLRASGLEQYQTKDWR